MESMECIIAYIKLLSKLKKEAIHKHGYFNGYIKVYIYTSLYTRDYNIDIRYSDTLWRFTMPCKCPISKEDLFSLIEAIFFEFEVIENETNNNS